MWHQGENDMFNKEFKPNYGKNLKNFLASWRRDLKTPDLKFYIGELCTKTIWGMDNRENMYAIRTGQKAVTDTDPLAEYIPTSHDAVEIGGEEGLHYHYGTLGQLEHGVNYADAYLRTIGRSASHRPPAQGLALCQGQPGQALRPRRTSQHGGRARLHPGTQGPAGTGGAGERQRQDRLQIQPRRRLQDLEWLGAARPRRVLRHLRPRTQLRERRCKARSPATSPSPSSRTAVRR